MGNKRKPSFHFVFAAILCMLWSLEPGTAVSEELAIVNRPVNTSGLTGLMITTAPFTLPLHTVEVAAMVLSENSVNPDYTITEYPVSISYGLHRNGELAVRSSYYHIKEGPSTTAPTEYVTGDVDLSYKWNFLPREEGSVRPAAALIIGGSMPTEKRRQLRIEGINTQKIRLGLSLGTEFEWRDHVLGIYTDGQVVRVNTNAGQAGPKVHDTYGQFNAGLILPISKYQNLQMFTEYTVVKLMDIVYVNGNNYTAFTYGLRLVTERFNLTIGSQNIHKVTEGFEDSDRIGGMLSIKF